MSFLFGFVCGVLAFIVLAVIIHLRAEKAKRRAFEREVAAIDRKYSAPPPSDQQRASRPTCPSSEDHRHHWVDVTTLGEPQHSRWLCSLCGDPQEVVSVTVNTGRVSIPTLNGALAFEALLPGSTEHASVGDVRYVVHRPIDPNPKPISPTTRKDVH